MESVREAEELTIKGNSQIMKGLVDSRGLGPLVAKDNMQGNAAFWITSAKKWNISAKEARRRSCANCEYGKINTDYLKAMEHIPYNKYDKDGGIRVFCDKYEFICHATRVCQSWEEDTDEKD